MGKILYRVGEQVMLRSDYSVVGDVVNYVRGSEEPYVIRLENGTELRANVSAIRRYNAELVNKSNDKENTSMNILQKIAHLGKSEETRLFEDYGVVDEKGELTATGVSLVLRKVFEDKDLRAAILAEVKAVAAEEKKSKK